MQLAIPMDVDQSAVAQRLGVIFAGQNPPGHIQMRSTIHDVVLLRNHSYGDALASNPT